VHDGNVTGNRTSVWDRNPNAAHIVWVNAISEANVTVDDCGSVCEEEAEPLQECFNVTWLLALCPGECVFDTHQNT
jgi:hypothetical protein